MSSAARWAQVKALFHDALDRPPAARAAWLAGACGDDPGLRSEVEALLAAHVADHAFLEASAPAAAARFLDDPPVGAERHVGPYRLVRELGRGGMGAVYLAERAGDGFRQTVALKVIKRGLDTDAMVRRFRRERQLLATLDHPHIARLLDGGSTEDGRPYLVMELIEGEPLDAWCARRAPSREERLRLFLQVCAAVHFAHQRLVVHRDLKPGNVLVAADGSPRLLDFGLARLLDRDLGSASQTTRDALLPGAMTPAYASPEQVRGEPVTTQSDVYGLGLLLYELLTGVRAQRFARGTLHELEAVVCGRDPPPPSAHAAGLSRDLDLIVARALHKDAPRRYASAEQLADDVHRFLERRPVLARPDGWAYRASRFVQRNAAVVAAATALAVVAAGGVGAVAWQAQVARRERVRAEAAQRAAEARAQELGRVARALTVDFVDAVQDLPGARPLQERLARHGLSLLAQGGGSDAPQDPVVQREIARGYQRIAGLHMVTGDVAGAVTIQRRAVRALAALAHAAPADAAAWEALAAAHEQAGDFTGDAGDAAGAAAHQRRALDIRTRIAAVRPGDPDALQALWSSHYFIGRALLQVGDSAGALAAHRRMLALDRALDGAGGAPRTTAVRLRPITTLHAFARTLAATGDRAGAARHFREALARAEALHALEPGNPQFAQATSRSHLRLAQTLLDGGAARDALAHARAAVAIGTALARVDTANMETVHDLAMGQSTAAGAFARLGDGRAARAALDSADAGLVRLTRHGGLHARARRTLTEVRVRRAALQASRG